MRVALGHSLMVEQQTLTLYIAVRVRVPQPEFNRPCAGLIVLVLVHVTRTAGSTMSRRAKQSAGKPSRMPHRAFMPEGIPARPP